MDSNKKCKVEVCFSPMQFPLFETGDSIVVVIDILRASSVITTMFMNGVKSVIPVSTIEEAKQKKAEGFMVVAERDAKKLDFADFGNSPFYFTKDVVEGKTLIYSTTNGTHAITMGKNAKQVVIGSFLNLTALIKYLSAQKSDVIFLCAGWKDKFCLEDTLMAGAAAQNLLENTNFFSECDSAYASIDLWEKAKPCALSYLEKAAQKIRLKNMGLDDVIPYCFTPDQTDIIPILQGKELVVMK